MDRTNRRRLSKAQVAVTSAKRNVAIATKKLSDAMRALLHSRAGSSKEAQWAKRMRAAAKDFVAARKKLHKALKKRKRIATRLRKKTARGKP